MRCRVAVNCAGLYADEVARLAGDDSFEIYPRKGEFLVFDPPGGEPLERILLPVPTKRTKGVLVFPTIDGKVVAGPTAVDQEDKERLVGAAARREMRSCRRRSAMYPPLEDAEPIAAYAGLRPAGRGVNYLIGPSQRVPAARERGGDPLDGPDRVARDRRARLRDRRRARRGARPGAAARARLEAAARRPVVAAHGRVPGAMTLLLGIDEGTTAVKAALFDERPAHRSRGAPREGQSPPAARLGRAGRRGGAERGGRGGRRGARGRARGGGGMRARPPGRVGAGLGRGERRAR